LTGAELLTYVKRGLRENGVPVEDSAERDAELLDLVTEGRDDLVEAFALAAPVVVKQVVTLEVDPADERLYNFPDDAADPLRVIEIRTVTHQEPLDPSAHLNRDGGHYRWNSLRQVQLAEFAAADGGVEVDVVLGAAEITDETSEANIGLPTTCHRALGKYAIAMALERGGERSPDRAIAAFQRAVERLERIYSDYDANGGAALREALMTSIGYTSGDMLS
jgi:hypothetical protein